ncbi:MAG TPA: carboxypeptidase-like regulatory domain-containing protein [Clostridiales bacterium]|nr:carboxypeptidase-like regulatory domain-containing protein [Clostridiales bacterium]HQP68809.1 carboxypeptidase-like regulatory domain-containing protein [Clostridiales bacterium]
MKNLTVYTALIILLIFALISPSEYLNAQQLNLNIMDTYLMSDSGANIRGPQGTTLDVMLINNNDTIRHTNIFPENGMIFINNALTGINDDNYTPSNTDFIKVVGNNVVYSPKVSETKGNNNNNYTVKVFNSKGELVSNVVPNKHEGYITAHFDGNGVSSGKYFFQVNDGNKSISQGFLFNKDNSSSVIPSNVIEEMNNSKVENNYGNSKGSSKFRGTVEAHFTYTPNEAVDAPIEYQHEPKTFVEYIDVAESGDTDYFPYHILSSLEQYLDAYFQVNNVHTNLPIANANARLLNGEKEIIGYVTADSEGKFSITGLPCDSTFCVQVSDENLRGIEYDIRIPPRIRINDVCNQPYLGIIPGDGVHKIGLVVEPSDFVGKSNGTNINNPSLTIERALEGQIRVDTINGDGLVLRDYVMGDKIKVYNPTSEQVNAMEKTAKEIFGGTNINDYFTIVDTARIEPGDIYNYITGDENAGINWIGNDEDRTATWEKNMYNNNGKMFANMCVGGESKCTGSSSGVHELMWYLYTDCVFSEDSPINPEGGNIGINDPLSVQYRNEINKSKYKFGTNTGECSDYYINVEKFDSSSNPTNVLILK